MFLQVFLNLNIRKSVQIEVHPASQMSLGATFSFLFRRLQ